MLTEHSAKANLGLAEAVQRRDVEVPDADVPCVANDRLGIGIPDRRVETSDGAQPKPRRITERSVRPTGIHSKGSYGNVVLPDGCESSIVSSMAAVTAPPVTGMMMPHPVDRPEAMIRPVSAGIPHEGPVGAARDGCRSRAAFASMPSPRGVHRRRVPGSRHSRRHRGRRRDRPRCRGPARHPVARHRPRCRATSRSWTPASWTPPRGPSSMPAVAPSSASMPATAGVTMPAGSRSTGASRPRGRPGSPSHRPGTPTTTGSPGGMRVRAAAAGMIGISMTNTTGSVAPTRSSIGLIGTNPIAIAAPAGHRPAVQPRHGDVDRSSRQARGRGARGYADPARLGDRPRRATRRRTRRRRSRARSCRSAVSRRPPATRATGWPSPSTSSPGSCRGDIRQADLGLFDTAAPSDLGQLFLVIDPGAIGDAPAFGERLGDYLDGLTEAPTRPDAPGRVLVPGEPEAAAEASAGPRAWVDARHVADCGALAARFGIAPPASDDSAPRMNAYVAPRPGRDIEGDDR